MVSSTKRLALRLGHFLALKCFQSLFSLVPVQSGSASECYVNYIIVSLVTCHLIVNLSGDWLPICFRLSNLILELFRKTVLPRVTPFFAENGVTTGNQSDPGFVDAVKG